MALFSGVPDYGPLIWMPQQFPEGESGVTGLMSGVTGGLQAGGQFKSDKAAWNAGGKVGPKPNPFKYYFGAGAAPTQAGGANAGFGGGGGGVGDNSSDLAAAIDRLINALTTQFR